ncbi:DNA-binding response regulator [Clostridium sp. 2-1]|uniref:LytR/AlgR family response regulator transcription factor n=1 Tax=Clostridium TaxID=1485 RepID=UPI000B3F7FBC|nr:MULTISPECIES: LytTR family DNA-binding domain-containing protein [Clostridium]MBN7572828.1 response regulator transcription factor [Clostridium beijerinckii]MBN7578168.1 response regulator transcription factor [Clostridium beijerinckii]MBN7582602.1 response regulator transcription factor [Clostridium beijerinckii]MBO0521842.1 response regulator transcription factor [Clostridium beijerinckii]NOW92542.1 two-component system LytT family response regulator [Clostridium beijerinckii]
MNIKVLIVDDEIGIRTIIKKILDKSGGFEVVGETDNGEEAIDIFKEHRPNVVFFDIEMPKCNGIDCARVLTDIDPKTIIIFATAHAEYMSEAFQLYAFDYLIKPFKVERVMQTLDRIKNLNKPSYGDGIDKIIKHEKGLDKLMIKNKEGISFVDTKEIVLVQREESSTVIYTKTDSFTTSISLSDIEEKLDHTQFFRSHKSYIINLSLITKIYPYGRWTYIVKLKNTDKDALLTHEKYEEIKKLFSL